jgi:hypothetical protein
MQIEAARISSDEEVKANGVANNNSSERLLPGDRPDWPGFADGGDRRNGRPSCPNSKV